MKLPHEVFKETIEKAETLDELVIARDGGISLLLSVKEMVETKKNTRIIVKDSSNAGKMKTIGYHQALSDLQSLLDSEINKVKEL